ncbi:hypothetical protein [Devosia sp. FKR38]|uniref:hypothetical protein n=1 Tax=Devosia sp. FKR38 TaxID=2562312 RepID=UPI0010C072E2|nr:hypothetical protein [Devosia sp. FKR38]
MTETATAIVTSKNLDDAYGEVRPAARVDPAELSNLPGTRQRLDENSGPVLRRYMQSAIDGVLLSVVLHRTIPILWAIDEEGSFWFALEEVIDTATAGYLFPFARDLLLKTTQAKLGHPAVVGATKARLGGEIYFDDGLDPPAWVLNNKSGRFGYGEGRRKEHLNSAHSDLAVHGIDVVVDLIVSGKS